jgi:hypothetical protein
MSDAMTCGGGGSRARCVSDSFRQLKVPLHFVKISLESTALIIQIVAAASGAGRWGWRPPPERRAVGGGIIGGATLPWGKRWEGAALREEIRGNAGATLRGKKEARAVTRGHVDPAQWER